MAWYAASPWEDRPSHKAYGQAFAPLVTPANKPAFAAAVAALSVGHDDGAIHALAKPVQACTASPADDALWSVQVLEGLRT